MAEAGRARPLVIGIGADDRSDDGAGLDVARALARDPSLEGDVRAWPGELTGLLDVWKDRGRVLLVDAVRSGAPPGTVHRWEIGPQRPFALPRTWSTHGFSLAAVLELARTLGELPPSVVVYGIEAAEVGVGSTRSPDVARAVVELARSLTAELRLPAGAPASDRPGAASDDA